MSSLIESFEKAVVKLRRRRISKSLFDRFDGEVQYGPFSGLRLDRKNTSSKGQLGLKVLGLYESVVVERITSLAPFGDLINIGACDGYFTLGLLKGELVQRSICFESELNRQKAITRYAKDNLLQDRVVVLGEATENIGDQIERFSFQPTQSLVICDIEGAEFDLLSQNFLTQLSGATIIVELHDRIQGLSKRSRQQLIERLPDGYQHEILVSQPADYSGIDDLEKLTDNDLALLMSEGRKLRGEWLLATPPATGEQKNTG